MASDIFVLALMNNWLKLSNIDQGRKSKIDKMTSPDTSAFESVSLANYNDQFVFWSGGYQSRYKHVDDVLMYSI